MHHSDTFQNSGRYQRCQNAGPKIGVLRKLKVAEILSRCRVSSVKILGARSLVRLSTFFPMPPFGATFMSTALRLTVAQYDQMVERGAFDHLEGKIELLLGEICSMNPAGPVHDWLIEFLTNWSIRSTTADAVSVRIQSGLSLPELNSRPEPDLLWVKPQNYRHRHPTAEDVLLLIEVAYSSIQSDRNTKQALYASAGISEYWIVDAESDQLFVYRNVDPAAGQYREVQTLNVGDTVVPECVSGAILELSRLFG